MPLSFRRTVIGHSRWQKVKLDVWLRLPFIATDKATHLKMVSGPQPGLVEQPLHPNFPSPKQTQVFV